MPAMTLFLEAFHRIVCKVAQSGDPERDSAGDMGRQSSNRMSVSVVRQHLSERMS
jgi:hypothetical protein